MKADRCPFCGELPPDPPLIETEYGACVSCRGCAAQGPSCFGITPEESEAEAIELWNKRTLGRAETK